VTYAFSGPIGIDSTPPTYGKVIDLHTTYRVDVSNLTATYVMNAKICESDDGKIFYNHCTIYKATGFFLIS
jgi:hypothetical protein